MTHDIALLIDDFFDSTFDVTGVARWGDAVVQCCSFFCGVVTLKGWVLL
jgi:hypothetical protein